MQLIHELETSLANYFTWDKRLLNGTVKLMLALFVVRTVNLAKVAHAYLGSALASSSYRRLQRFFSHAPMDYHALAHWVVKLFGFDQGEHYLVLDRTNWKWGKKNINILSLCIAYKQVAVPVFFLVLTHQGNSSTKHRIALMKRFIHQCPNVTIKGVLGDREFIGKRWFAWLKKNHLAFYIRIKQNAQTTNAQGLLIPVKDLFHDLNYQQSRLIKHRRKVYGHDVFLVGMRIEKELLIIVTDRAPDNAQQVLDIYGIRWTIETLFGCLKSKGFYFEDTHMTHRHRIKKMMAILTLVFCWSLVTGEWRHHQEKKIRIKKHGRPQYSLFRYGLDWISERIIKRGQKLRQLAKVCRKVLAGYIHLLRLTGDHPC